MTDVQPDLAHPSEQTKAKARKLVEMATEYRRSWG